MKKIVLGIIIGVVFTLSMQYGWKYYQYKQYKDDLFLFEFAKHDLEKKLEGARVLDVSLSHDSQASVNYVYDKLYDVNFSYERSGKLKRITAQYGVANGTWIAPNNTMFEILDGEAVIIYNKSQKEGIK